MRAKRNGDRAGHIKNYIYMIYKDADATLLRLFESFMESAPQLVLQLYILASEHNRFSPTEPLNSQSGGSVGGGLVFVCTTELCGASISIVNICVLFVLISCIFWLVLILSLLFLL